MSDGPTKPRMSRRPRSVVWQFFQRLVSDPYQARCKLCGADFPHAHNTTNLFHHLRSKHPESFTEAEGQREQNLRLIEELKVKAGKPITPRRGRPPKVKVRVSPSSSATESDIPLHSAQVSEKPVAAKAKKVSTGLLIGGQSFDLSSALTQWLSTDLLPSSVIHTPAFRNLLSMLGLNATVPAKKTVLDKLVPQLEDNIRAKVRCELDQSSTVALSVETWSYRDARAMVTVYAHLITENWTMASYVLDTFDCTEERTDSSLAAQLKKITEDWAITEKVSVLVTDRPDEIMSAAVKACGWEEIHCFGNALNCVVVEALASVPEIGAVLEKMRECITYFYRSVHASQELSSIQREHSLPSKRLKQDWAGLWTSTVAAATRVVEQFQAANTVLCLQGEDRLCLCDDDIEIIRGLLATLQVFQAAANEVSSRPFCSSAKLVPMVGLLHEVVSAGCVGADDLAETLHAALLGGLQVHLAGMENIQVLSCATLLDPRFKQHAFSDPAALEVAQETLARLALEVATQQLKGPQDVITSTAVASTSDSNGNITENSNPTEILNGLTTTSKELNSPTGGETDSAISTGDLPDGLDNKFSSTDAASTNGEKPDISSANGIPDNSTSNNSLSEVTDSNSSPSQNLKITNRPIATAESTSSIGKLTSGALWETFEKKLAGANALITESSSAENEMRRFFKEPNIMRSADPLQWWKAHSEDFPFLSVLARRFLCVPATGLQSSRIFTKEGIKFSQRRNNFRSVHLKNLLFLNQNLC